MSFKRDKKEEEYGGGNSFSNLEKTAVLQETRTFNETPVNARKCTHILTKILYLMNQGEQLVSREATDCFFAMTKLFQSKNVVLRRMVYLGIKELSTIADDVIIVTSSLTKDMTAKSRKITYDEVLQSVEELQKRREIGNEIRSKALAACQVYDTHGIGLIAEDDLITALWDINIRIDCDTIDRAEIEELASSGPMIRYKEFIEEEVLRFIEYL